MSEGKLKDATSIAEIKREMERMVWHSPFVRSAKFMAVNQNLSAQEQYMILSYHLLKALQVLQEAMLNAAPPTITIKCDGNCAARWIDADGKLGRKLDQGMNDLQSVDSVMGGCNRD